MVANWSQPDVGHMTLPSPRVAWRRSVISSSKLGSSRPSRIAASSPKPACARPFSVCAVNIAAAVAAVTPGDDCGMHEQQITPPVLQRQRDVFIEVIQQAVDIRDGGGRPGSVDPIAPVVGTRDVVGDERRCRLRGEERTKDAPDDCRRVGFAASYRKGAIAYVQRHTR